MAIRTVIFDLDGTITEQFLDFDAIRREMVLAQNAGAILEIMEKMPAPEQKRIRQILEKHETRAIEQSRLNESVERTLELLRSGSINIGVLTRNRRSSALAIADKHNLHFDAVIGRDDGPVKPDAFGVLRLCRHFGNSPQDTLVVGDYLYDMMSAKAAGAISVLIKTHSQSEQFSKYADFTISSLDEILQIIEDMR